MAQDLSPLSATTSRQIEHETELPKHFLLPFPPTLLSVPPSSSITETSSFPSPINYIIKKNKNKKHKQIHKQILFFQNPKIKNKQNATVLEPKPLFFLSERRKKRRRMKTSMNIRQKLRMVRDLICKNSISLSLSLYALCFLCVFFAFSLWRFVFVFSVCKREREKLDRWIRKEWVGLWLERL